MAVRGIVNLPKSNISVWWLLGLSVLTEAFEPQRTARTTRRSFPVSLFIEYEINNISCTERSEARRVATLHTDVSWVRMSETWRVACSHAVSMSSTSQTRPRALAHCNTASFPQENCSFPLDIHSQRFAPHSFPARLDKEIACCSKGESKPPGTGTKNG